MTRRSEGPVCDPDRMNLHRMAAAFVVACGGVFWALAAFSGAYVFRQIGMTQAVSSALIPLALTVIVFALGWFSEHIAAVLLHALSVACLVWGLIAGWDLGMWGLMITFFMAPMTISGLLYFSAWRIESACGGPKRAFSLLVSTDPSSAR